MNKYLKILMLSSGLVGAIAPTAINIDKDHSYNDLGGIYEHVEKMQYTLPRLSRINYKLNIDLDTNTGKSASTSNIDDSITTEDNDDGSNEIETLDDNSNIDNNSNVDNSSGNITFTTTDETGKQTTLTNQETINYLNETLTQTNVEYEELKNMLSKAIKDTMDYLDSYKNGETSLTNEQKIYIKEHANSIKFLAETLEDLSEDVLCCIDGCEDCDEDFEKTANQYITTINNLEKRIDALNSAIASLQFVNNIGNPFFFRHHYTLNNPHEELKNSNDTSNSQNDTDNNNAVIEVDDTSSNTENNTNTNNSVENTQSTQDNVDASNQDSVTNNDNDSATNNDDDKPTTFGLKSNIDTYAPTKRNIDTFFNTALYNNEYMNGNAYGYGYGAPYGYGGGYGYGMPYGAGFSNPYGGMGLNSNLVNREVVENQNNLNCQTHSSSANIDQQDEKDDTQKPKKFHTKCAKNIDTYTGSTIQSNVNTMGESRISKFFKEKFNNLRNKVRNKKGNNPSPTQNNQEKVVDSSVVEKKASNLNNTLAKDIDNNNKTNSLGSNPSIKTPDENNIETNELKKEDDIKARL